MSARTLARRAGLAARTISVLLRASASTDTLAPVAGRPGTPAAGPPSPSFCTSAARSLAMACCSGTTSTSVAVGWSSAAMILPMRVRLSA